MSQRGPWGRLGVLGLPRPRRKPSLSLSEPQSFPPRSPSLLSRQPPRFPAGGGRGPPGRGGSFPQAGAALCPPGPSVTGGLYQRPGWVALGSLGWQACARWGLGAAGPTSWGLSPVPRVHAQVMEWTPVVGALQAQGPRGGRGSRSSEAPAARGRPVNSQWEVLSSRHPHFCRADQGLESLDPGLSWCSLPQGPSLRPAPPLLSRPLPHLPRPRPATVAPSPPPTPRPGSSVHCKSLQGGSCLRDASPPPT